jgi:hypothetical protein
LEAWRQALRELFAKLPKNYPEATAAAEEIRHTFHTELAAAIQPPLNAHLKTMPRETYQEKQSLASWVNGELHNRLGLTIRCPLTGRQAILVADVRDSESQASRFRLEVHEGRRKERTYTSTAKLPELELMEDPPRLESLAKANRQQNGC